MQSVKTNKCAVRRGLTGCAGCCIRGQLPGQLRGSARVPAPQVALRDEVIVAISNKNYAGPGGMLDTWIEHVKRCKVGNTMVVALDEATRAHVAGQNVATMVFQLEVRVDSLSGHPGPWLQSDKP